MRKFTLAQKVSHNKKIHQDDVECTVDGRVFVFKRDEERNFRCVCGTVLTGGATSMSRHAKKCEKLR
jgi:acetone carboxylase gamma subunit